MWTSWTLKLCVPMVSAAVLASCTQEVSDSQRNRAAIDHATDRQEQNLRVTVKGCLSAGTGNNRPILIHARPVPLAEQPSDALSAANVTIPQDSDIRLAGDIGQLSRFTGQELTVSGILRHDGRDTIGTAGRRLAGPNPQDPRTDYSQAAATGQHHSEKVKQEAGPIGLQSMNNSTFPEMVVTRVESSGKKCATAPVEGRR